MGASLTRQPLQGSGASLARLGAPRRHRDCASIKTFSVVSLRYEREVIPAKARRTQTDNLKELARLRAVFGRVLIDSIKPHHVRAYLDKRGESAKVRANH